MNRRQTIGLEAVRSASPRVASRRTGRERFAGLAILALCLLLVAPACRRSDTNPSPHGSASAERSTGPVVETLTLATTTSVYDTGLAEAWSDQFRKETGIRLRVLSLGTGEALRTGREGGADVLVVHAPAAEKEFVEQGFGLERVQFMHNSLLIVGPGADPAEVAQADGAADAFRRVAARERPFLSRGDDSGTHKKERAIWTLLERDPKGSPWYAESGQGMADTLLIADNRSAYCLTDIATYLMLRNTERIRLAVLCDRGADLYNPYSVIRVNPERFPAGKIRHEAAARFAAYLTRADVQRAIGDFRRAELGQSIYVPDRLNSSTLTQP